MESKEWNKFEILNNKQLQATQHVVKLHVRKVDWL